jgi:hypothetical protein
MEDVPLNYAPNNNNNNNVLLILLTRQFLNNSHETAEPRSPQRIPVKYPKG